MTKCCPGCTTDRESKDFYGKDLCYKCIYKQKLGQLLNKRQCKICSKCVPKGRWQFCCDICYNISKSDQDKNHWTRKMSATA